MPIVREATRSPNSSPRAARSRKRAERHRAELATNLHEFPTFLRGCAPTSNTWEAFAEQATPTFTDLGVAAPGINRTFTEHRAVLGEHDAVLQKPRRLLGEDRQSAGRHPAAAHTARVAGQRDEAVCKELLRTASPACARPAASSACSTSSSWAPGRSTATTRSATSPARSRSAKACSGYKIALVPECRSNFVPGASTGAAGKHCCAGGERKGERHDARDGARRSDAQGRHAVAGDGRVPRLGSGRERCGAGSGASLPSAVAQPVGGASAGTTYYTPPSESTEAGGLLLNYLLGN